MTTAFGDSFVDGFLSFFGVRSGYFSLTFSIGCFNSDAYSDFFSSPLNINMPWFRTGGFIG